jgi:flagellar biosynthesis/type III secretory pathway protein FliH
MRLPPEEQGKYRRYLEELHYEASMAQSKSLDMSILDGIREGREQGLKEGIDLGVKKGIDLGIEKGIDLGIKKGMDLGIKKGMDLGIKEGEKLAAIQIARNLLESGLSSEAIQSATGLCKEEIEKLRVGTD